MSSMWEHTKDMQAMLIQSKLSLDVTKCLLGSREEHFNIKYRHGALIQETQQNVEQMVIMQLVKMEK